MNSIATAKDKEPSANEVGHQYNFQHLVFVTKYRYKMFRKSKTIEAIRKALYDVAERYKMTIKELSFGDDYSHVHLEVNVPNTMSISYAVQLLKGYSAYVVFREVPRHRLRYFKGHFWTAGYSNGSVGPRDEKTLQNYIRRQDISGQVKLGM
jgi:putative transposase